ncbi:hypothetical protein EDD85DRAFT_838370 [Armillaria nabsnona]|nr:hypothetical protein EDD85DRAFT_838370 [Armillaria nabsnona]
MQHQKAKHFKCNMCPRRLNTAGGLAVHIQQVHKLEPENLPRIENAIPGRDGYEVEIFGMEGIPAPDVADYKRRKEIELGLAAGSISQPPAKRPKTENRPMSEEELKAALEAHKALMGAGNTEPALAPADSSSGGVYGAPPQAYAAAPTAAPPGPPLGMPPGVPPFLPPPGMLPGQPPFPPPFPMPGFPPGPPPPGFPMPPFAPGMPPPGAIRPPFPPAPTFVPQQQGVTPPFPPPIPTNGSMTSITSAGSSVPATPPPPTPSSQTPSTPHMPVLPVPALKQILPPFKKETDLKFQDPNFSPDELRAYNSKYYVAKSTDKAQQGEESRGKKRARAEDFL